LLSEIPDIKMIDLAVEEHVEGYLVIRFVLVEIDIPGVEDGAQYILDTVGNTIYARVGDRGVRRLDKGDVLIRFVAPFVDIAQEFIRLQRCRIDVRLVFIPYFEEFVVEGRGLSFTDEVVDILALEFFEGGRKGSIAAGGEMDAGNSIVHAVSEVLAGLEG